MIVTQGPIDISGSFNTRILFIRMYFDTDKANQLFLQLLLSFPVLVSREDHMKAAYGSQQRRFKQLKYLLLCEMEQHNRCDGDALSRQAQPWRVRKYVYDQHIYQDDDGMNQVRQIVLVNEEPSRTN